MGDSFTTPLCCDKLTPSMKPNSKRRTVRKKTAVEEAPILFFSARGSMKKVKDLIKKGADVNAAYTKRSRSHPEVRRGSTALMEALLHGQEKIVNLLLKEGADINR